MNASSSPKPIGGFFELELPSAGAPLHGEAVALSTGRSCLCAILEFTRPKRCYVPQFTCDATLDPFLQRGVELVFYELNEDLEPKNVGQLEENDLFLVTNYWGIQRGLADRLSKEHGAQLIVDDTHDFNADHRYPESWSFTSARKYFGVPDGAFLYVPSGVQLGDVVSNSVEAFRAISLEHSIDRALGNQAQAFGEYQAYEKSLPCELHRISNYSRVVLDSLDVQAAFDRRRENFLLLADALDSVNSCQVPRDAGMTPFVYPFLPETPIEKSGYHKELIFVPTYWPDVLQRPSTTCPTSQRYTRDLIPLPIDHRYGAQDMARIVEVTHNLLSNR